MFLNLIPYFLSLVVQGEFQTINRRNQQWFLSRSVPTRCVFSRIAKPYAWIASPILQNGTIWFTHVKMVHALSLISESYTRSFPPPIPFSHAGWYNLVYPCNDGTFPLISGSYTRTYRHPIPFSHAGWCQLVYPCNDGTFSLISGSYTSRTTRNPSPSHRMVESGSLM